MKGESSSRRSFLRTLAVRVGVAGAIGAIAGATGPSLALRQVHASGCSCEPLGNGYYYCCTSDQPPTCATVLGQVC